MRTYFLALLSALTTLVGAWSPTAQAVDPAPQVSDSTPSTVNNAPLGRTGQAQDLLAPLPQKEVNPPAIAPTTAQTETIPTTDGATTAPTSTVQILSPQPAAKLGQEVTDLVVQYPTGTPVQVLVNGQALPAGIATQKQEDAATNQTR